MPIDYGTNNVNTSGSITAASGNFTNLSINNTSVSISGHNHTVSNITDFNSGVSGLVSGVYSPISHSHGNITSSGTIGTSAGKVITTSDNGLLIADNDVQFACSSITVATEGDYATNGGMILAPQAIFFYDNSIQTTAYTGKIGSVANLPLITTTDGVVTTGVFGSSANTFCQGDDSRLSDSRTPLSHTHGNITNAGAIGSTANRPLITTTAGVITTGVFGSAANTFCQGNDSRLSDTRTPTDNTVSTAKIVNSNVTYAKIQNVSATDRILGRSTAGAGVIEEITCTSFARSLLDDADASAARITIGCPPTGSPNFTGTASFASATFSASTVPVVSITVASTTDAAALQIKGRTTDGAAFLYFSNNAGTANNGFITGFANNIGIYGANYTGPLIVDADGKLTSQPTYDNTAAGSNVVVTSAGLLRRTSSSIKYKKDIEDLDLNLVHNAIDNLRPVWYRSKNPIGDDKVSWSQIGLIAEEASLVEPRIVRYKTVQVVETDGQRTEIPLENPEPEDIDYGKLAVLLLAEIKTLKQKISQLESVVNNTNL